MKANYLYGIIILLLADSCTQPSQNRFQLEALISEARTAELALLTYPVYRDGTWYKQTDSARVVDGKIHFEGEISGITPAYLSFENMDEVSLYLAPGNMQLQMNRLHPYNFTYSETCLMEEIKDYRMHLGAVPQQLCEKNRRTTALNEQCWQVSPEDRDSMWRQFMQSVREFKSELAVEDSLRMAYVEAYPERTIAPHLLCLSIRAGRNDSDHLRALYDRIPETAKNRILRELAGIQLSFAPGKTGYDVGDRSCDFERHEVAGGSVRLSDYIGSVVLLDFWASWCGPCLKATPAIRTLVRKYTDKDLQVIGVSVDDDSTAWRQALAKHGLNYCPQVLSCESADDNEFYFPEQADLADLYQVTQIPCLILIDREGRITARWQQITPIEESQLEEMLH